MFPVLSALIAALTTTALIGCSTSAQKTPQAQKQTVGVEISQIQSLIKDLSSQDADRQRAEEELSKLARDSDAQRRIIIEALFNDVSNHPELSNHHVVLSTSLAYWRSVTTIFSSLQAVEAVDVMISCIYCGNGLSGSLSERPAFDALSRMGQLAVPKLAVALRSDPDEYGRMQVALCLGNIGGNSAKKALTDALPAEKNKDVRRHIKWSLATIAGDPSKYW